MLFNQTMALTKSDTKTIGNIVRNIVKDGLKAQKEDILEEVGGKLKDQKQGILEEIDAKLTNLISGFYDRIDPILKEIPASRDERTLLAGKIAELEERMEPLEEIHPQGKHLTVV